MWEYKIQSKRFLPLDFDTNTNDASDLGHIQPPSANPSRRQPCLPFGCMDTFDTQDGIKTCCTMFFFGSI